MECRGVCNMSRHILFLKTKQYKNRKIVWENKRSQEIEATAEGCGRGGLWPPSSVGSQTLHFGACSSPRGLLRCVCVQLFWASFTIFFDPLGLKYILILWFRLINLNSAKTLKISKTTHNIRNKGIIRIAIQFNLLK